MEEFKDQIIAIKEEVGARIVLDVLPDGTWKATLETIAADDYWADGATAEDAVRNVLNTYAEQEA